MTQPTNQPENPLVSVVVTTYNRPSYLERAVESVREQTYDPVELVVVDDHSDEPASRVFARLDLDGLHDMTFERHERNQGANAARNTGIDAATGKFVAFLDDDDRWRPEKIERQVAAATPEVGVVYTGIEATRGETSSVHIPPEVPGDITKRLLCENVVGTLSTVMVRTETARAVPLDERFLAWADLEWYVNLSTETTFRRVPEPLVIYEFDSHHRLSDDYEKKRRGYELFVDEFEPLAAEYGRLFGRKFRGWAAFRIGSTALDCERYGEARRHLGRAMAEYPFERRFAAYFAAALGGRPSHEVARLVNDAVST